MLNLRISSLYIQVQKIIWAKQRQTASLQKKRKKTNSTSVNFLTISLSGGKGQHSWKKIQSWGVSDHLSLNKYLCNTSFCSIFLSRRLNTKYWHVYTISSLMIYPCQPIHKKNNLENTWAVWTMPLFFLTSSVLLVLQYDPVSSWWVRLEKKKNTLKCKLSASLPSPVNGSITLLSSHYSAYAQCICFFYTVFLLSPAYPPLLQFSVPFTYYV